MINVMGKKYKNEKILVDDPSEVTGELGLEIKNQENDMKPLKSSSNKSKVIVKIAVVVEGKKLGQKYVKKRAVNMKMRSESVLGTYDIWFYAVLTCYTLWLRRGI